jgi:hypothetical protein|tara:strand:- start:1457 stop:1831 length:375 start_codon:yes stop_codon:yes gene_type:complete
MAKIAFSEEEKRIDSVISKIEKEWPEMTKEFRAIQDRQYALFCIKQNDYGTGNIAMGTMLDTPENIRLALTGLIVRMNDKINRLLNLVVKNGKTPQNEPISDSFMDLSVYGIMSQIVSKEKWGK